VPIDTDPRALAILHEWVKTTGAEMNEARLRMTRIPKGADLILNKVSGAPGFWIGNVRGACLQVRSFDWLEPVMSRVEARYVT
jgi:molybdopterin-biosynthesis enzyme MoeA-like protein